MSWTGKPCRFTIQILIKKFKMMALHSTLVCDWKLVHLLNLVCSFPCFVLFMCFCSNSGRVAAAPWQILLSSSCSTEEAWKRIPMEVLVRVGFFNPLPFVVSVIFRGLLFCFLFCLLARSSTISIAVLLSPWCSVFIFLISNWFLFSFSAQLLNVSVSRT